MTGHGSAAAPDSGELCCTQARIAEEHRFQTPLDEVDAAARVLHPVIDGLASGRPLYGVFLKDYAETEW